MGVGKYGLWVGETKFWRWGAEGKTVVVHLIVVQTWHLLDLKTICLYFYHQLKCAIYQKGKLNHVLLE